jgi:hypothetical protein
LNRRNGRPHGLRHLRTSTRTRTEHRTSRTPSTFSTFCTPCFGARFTPKLEKARFQKGCSAPLLGDRLGQLVNAMPEARQAHEHHDRQHERNREQQQAK